MRSATLLITILALGLSTFACGGGGGGGTKDNSEALAFVNMAVGNSWTYDIWTGGAILDGKVEVVGIDPEFVDGIDSFKVEVKENQFLVVTRWYQVTHEGMYLLGEEVVEQSNKVLRTFTEPILVVPYPLEDEYGNYIQTWVTESALAEGGSETYRYDNVGREALELQAGSFDAFHLVLTRTDGAAAHHQYNQFFVPANGFVQFEYPPGDVWKLR